MPWTRDHIDNWLKPGGKRLYTADGRPIQVYEFAHQPDDAILVKWAKHFRNHYCLDTEIDALIDSMGCTRTEYLRDVKFPDKKPGLGPGVRSGDFAEILVADFLQYVSGFWVPRTRYSNKINRNQSPAGCDVMAFGFADPAKPSPKDTLALYEAKAQLSGTKAKSRLQDAVDDSGQDPVRKAESLNALRQRMIRERDPKSAAIVARFQNITDRPYKQAFGAVALFTSALYDPISIGTTLALKHPQATNLSLVVIHGPDLMDLVHSLYERAANEA
jgi:hypothetical protein